MLIQMSVVSKGNMRSLDCKSFIKKNQKNKQNKISMSYYQTVNLKLQFSANETR